MVKKESYTKREQLVLNTCGMMDENITIGYNSPFVGRQPKHGKRWEEVKLNPQGTELKNPNVCKKGTSLFFRRSTKGHAWRAYIWKDE